MVVQHNITAMNSNRMLGVTTSSQAKSTEKLSSGYKINRSADDASGLSISEKMRKQIRGLTQASANAQDGISTVQTAEGALNEVHDMLQRMNELAVKASNGTLSESDRNDVQKEVNALVNEIDRVSTTTKFNETYLLKGNNGGEVGKLTYDDAKDAMGGLAFDADGVNDATAFAAATPSLTASDQKATNTDISAKSVTINSVSYTLVESTKNNATDADSKKAGFMSVTEVVKDLEDNEATPDTNKYFSSMDDLLTAIKQDNGADVKNVTTKVDGTSLKVKIEAFADQNDPLDISLHVGADSSADNKINLNINMMSARGLGINGLDVSGDNPDNATASIDTIKDAIAKVSSQRSSLGGVQNRLEHTIKNVDNVIENTSSAEAAIRDTDMATEMVQYSKNNILAQAGQSMLAQANQSNQGVLSLLG